MQGCFLGGHLCVAIVGLGQLLVPVERAITECSATSSHRAFAARALQTHRSRRPGAKVLAGAVDAALPGMSTCTHVSAATKHRNSDVGVFDDRGKMISKT